MKAKKINAIIVKDLSRLGRNYIEVGNYIEQIFPLFDIRFIALNDGIDSYKDPKSINNVIVPFKNLMNDEYCRDISNKIRSVFDTKKKNGEYLSPYAPYGYVKDPENKHHLIIDPESASIVKLIYKWTLEGMGRTKIAQKLNEMGVLNPLGYKTQILKLKYNRKIINKDTSYTWESSVINNILRNEVYCGDMVQNKGKLLSYKVHKYIRNPKEDWIRVENTHEAIIDRKTFEKVQDAIISRDTRVGQDGNLSIYAGHIKCADCGRSMMKRLCHNEKGEQRGYFYYACTTYVRKSKDLCTRHSIRSDKLEKAVFEAIKLQISLVLNANNVIKEINKSKKLNYKMETISNNITRQEKELDKYNKLKKASYEDWKLGIITETEYFEYAKEYSSKVKQIEAILQKLYSEKANANSNNNEDEEWINDFLKNKNIKTLSKQVIDELVENIYVHEGGNITIKFKFQDEYQNAVNYIQANGEILDEVLSKVINN